MENVHYREIIELGRHRLMCGDATRREDVMRLIGNDTVNLVLTDPPYGIKIFHQKGTIGGGKHNAQLRQRVNLQPKKHIAFKDDTREAAKGHYEIVRELTDKLIIWGGSYFTDFLPVSGGWIFWDKNRQGMIILLPVTRKGDSCTGHECFPPRNSTSGSPNVFMNSIPAHRQDDSWASHTCTHPKVPHGTHGGTLSSRSTSVYVNGKQLGRIGDPVSCDSNVASGSSNVFAGGVVPSSSTHPH